MSATSLMRLGCKPKLTSTQVAHARQLMNPEASGPTVVAAWASHARHSTKR